MNGYTFNYPWEGHVDPDDIKEDSMTDYTYTIILGLGECHGFLK